METLRHQSQYIDTFLGPTVFGRIPNFTNAIFPTDSIPNLTLVANLGIVLFLFVVGMEIDITYLKKNWKIASTVGLSSLIIPFCLGVALSVGLYKDYVGPEERDRVSFGVYSLFIGVAVAITAFPVLARILTELGLLRDRVGVVVLAAGISNDIIGWILLALTITLANSAKPINTLYIILLTIAWFIVLVWAVKPLLGYYLRRSGSIENGPSEMAVSVCILLAFMSAFYTDVIGVHPIFGAFLAGAIIPRENQFVVKLTEKIEDFITLILLPLYFSLAGLNVNIGALNDGTSWGYVIAAIIVAMFGKVVGGMIPARLHGLRWRESFTVGGLMSCKGIVEIVVLQLGLQAGILSVKVFTMFVIMALITTFLTTPLTLKLYPMWYRTKVSKWRNGEIEWDGTPIEREGPSNGSLKEFKLAKIVVVFDTVESMPITMMVTQLLAAPQQQVEGSRQVLNTASPRRSNTPQPEGTEMEHPDLSTVRTDNTMPGAFLTQKAELHGLFVSGLRLVDLTERTADLIQVMSGELIEGDRDPVIQVFSTFTKINHIPFEGKVAVTPQIDRSNIIMSVAQSVDDFLMVTWDDGRELVTSPELLKITPQIREGAIQTHVKLGVSRDLFEHARCQVGLFIDRGFALCHHEPTAIRRVYVPFFGGHCDRLALGLAVYLAKNANIEVTVAVVSDSTSHITDKNGSTTPESHGHATVHDDADTHTLLPSEAWDYITSIYDTLPSGMHEKFTLIRIDSSKSITACTLEAFGGESLVSDLILIGRATSFTANTNISDHQNPVTSSSASIASQSSVAPYSGDLLGAATTELVTSPLLKSSFFVCNAPKSMEVSGTTVADTMESTGKPGITVSSVST